MLIDFKVRSEGTGGRVKSDDFTIQYKISSQPRDGVITVIHELLHAFSLSGCNAVVEGKTTFKPKDKFEDESFVHLLDRVVELIAIISQMDKEPKQTNYTERKQEAYDYLCIFYTQSKAIYGESKIYPCLKLLKIPERVEELNRR